MTGWREGLGPWTPVIEGGKLYGRGGADDGYAVFCALAALRALQQEKRAHARSRRSSSNAARRAAATTCRPTSRRSRRASARPTWSSGSTRAAATTTSSGARRRCADSINGVLTVEVLTEGVHSGDASGVVPGELPHRAPAPRAARRRRNRHGEAGGLPCARFRVERSEQAKRAAEVLGEEIWRKFPFATGMRPMASDLADLVLNRTWRPMLAVTGADGPARAGERRQRAAAEDRARCCRCACRRR